MGRRSRSRSREKDSRRSSHSRSRDGRRSRSRSRERERDRRYSNERRSRSRSRERKRSRSDDKVDEKDRKRVKLDDNIDNVKTENNIVNNANKNKMEDEPEEGEIEEEKAESDMTEEEKQQLKIQKRREKMKLWQSQQNMLKAAPVLPSANLPAVEEIKIIPVTLKLPIEKAAPSVGVEEKKSFSSFSFVKTKVAPSNGPATVLKMTTKKVFPIVKKGVNKSSALLFGGNDEEEGIKKVSQIDLLLKANIFADENKSKGKSSDNVVKKESKVKEQVVEEKVEGDALDSYMDSFATATPAPHLATISLQDIVNNNATTTTTNNDIEMTENKEQEGEEFDEDQYYLEFKAALKKAKEESEAHEKKREMGLVVEKNLEKDEENPVDSMYAYGESESKSALEILKEKMKKKELKKVDHESEAMIAIYNAFKVRKNFYIESPAITALTDSEVAAIREEKGVKIRGKKCPKPITSWQQCGLSDKIMYILEKQKYLAPFAIQAQAIPAIMSGRDVIAIAKTGSGKTLGFLLPLFRHVEDQPNVKDGEGPIGLIMAPARELAVQIYNMTKPFTKVMNFRAAAVYGGAPVSEQIACLKRGCEIVICTPGRMIDILTMNSGRLIALSRVTFVVMDEADRMFDMGFEPQITMIIDNIRPSRQIVLFSATFPPHVEKLARRILHTPVEITIGGRSEVAQEIEQLVEVRDESEKWPRLLQILGLWFEKGSILIFVDTQQRCDSLFQDLMKAGYFSLSLHGGKDQSDRDQTIADFKNHLRTIMVATSVAGRGLDVKELNLVINYNCPNHLEDYVHRVGRTGRAGNKGTAITFISPSEDRYASDLIKALTASEATIPPELKELEDQFNKKIETGESKKRISGYSTKGFKFDDSEADGAAKVRDMWRKQIEVEAGLITLADLVEEKMEEREKKLEGGDDEKEEVVPEGEKDAAQIAKDEAKAKALAIAQKKKEDHEKYLESKMNPIELIKYKAQKAAEMISMQAAQQPPPSFPFTVGAQDANQAQLREKAIKAAMDAAMKMNISASAGSLLSSTDSSGDMLAHLGIENKGSYYAKKLDINDYPQKARWTALTASNQGRINDLTGCAMTIKGTHILPGKKLAMGEEKLFCLVEGPTERAVHEACTEIVRVLEEETLKIGFDPKQLSQQFGKYSVV